TLQGGLTTTPAGARYLMSSGTFNVSNNARFTGSGTTEISSAYVNVSDTMFVNHLVQSGGYLEGDGVLYIDTDFNWTTGYQRGVGTTHIPPAGELYLSTAGTKYLHTRTLDNFGNCDHSGGVFYLGNAAHFNNQPGAEYLIQDARQITHHTGDYSYFDNYGTFRKGSGNGTSYVQTINFSSFADLVVDEGTLSMDFLVTLQGGVTTTLAGARYLMASGTFNVSNNARFAGSGTTEITGAYVNTSDTMFVDHLVQSGGYLQGAGVLWIEEDFNWISGYQQGTGSTVIPSGSQLWLTSTGGKYLYERILENWGSCSHNSGHFLLGNSAVFNNQPGAQYLLSDGRYLLHNTGATSAFNNYGTFRKEVGTGTSYVQSLNFSNWNADLVVDEGTLSMDFLVTLQGGTTTTPTGARYLMSSGTFNISNNARFTGSGTTEITGAYVNTSDTMFVDHLVQSGGYLEGDGVLYIGETFDWLTGYQRGIGTTVIAVGSQLNLLTGSNKYINYRTLENLADCYHTAGNIYLGDGAVINNQPGAFYELTDSRYIAHYVGDIGTFNNYGLLSKAGGTGTAYIQGLYLNNLAGNLEVTAGTLHLDYWGNFQGGNTNTLGGANLKLNSGNFYSSNNAAFTGAGTVEIAGAVVAVTDTMFVEHLLQTGGFQEGEGVVCITDDFDWRIGTLRGTGKLLIPFGSDLSLTTGSSKYVISHRIDIFGNCDHLTGVLYLAEDPLLSIHPGGVYDLADNSSINYWYGVTGSIENSGLLHKSTGGGTATINSLPVNNSGVLSADTGTLRLASCQLDNLNGGTLAGNGTIDLATAAGFVQAGSIAPGVSPGILYLTGSLPSESTSVLALEFAGTTVGDDYDQLAVSGTAHLDGIITPIMLNDFLPDPGTVFTVMTHGGHSGFFQESIITINDSLYFTIDYEATEVLLVARKLGIPILEITYEGGVLLLNWNIVEEAQYYNVYQLDGPHGEPVLLTQTTATEYDATGLLTEGRLFFQVTSEGVDATSAAAARQAARWRAGNRN
ncbi:MAG: hypothetical protein ISR91_03850, partial [Candidatus Delongbacteria bacterium]|nr:hypothetical protein [Candidatus Delongbacteria bacterium]